MMRFLASLFLVLVMTSGASVLRAAEQDCDSSCLDAKGVKVSTVTLDKSIHTYKISTTPDGERCEVSSNNEECKMGTATCEAAVSYPQFGLTDDSSAAPSLKQGIVFVNRRMKDEASKMSCSESSGIVSFSPMQIYARPELISIVINDLDYCAGCGGSCHGSTDIYTFDVAGAKGALKVSDIVKSEDYPALQAALIDAFAAQYSEGLLNIGPDAKQEAAKLIQDVSGNEIEIHAGIVRINIGGFIFSCAEGNYHPVELPKKFIKHEFLAMLGKENL